MHNFPLDLHAEVYQRGTKADAIAQHAGGVRSDARPGAGHLGAIGAGATNPLEKGRGRLIIGQNVRNTAIGLPRIT